MWRPLYVCPPALPLGSLHEASTRCIYHIIPTPPDQFFFLSQVSPLSRLFLFLLIRVRVRVCVRPMYMYPLRNCRCTAHPCPVHNCDRPSSLQIFSKPPSFYVFADGFCDMRIFCTRGYREFGPAEKIWLENPRPLENRLAVSK